MRRAKALVVLVLCLTLLSSCSTTEEARLAIDDFDEVYHQAYDFEIIAPFIVAYFNEVEKAYNASDKESYASFVEDKDILEECQDAIESYQYNLNSVMYTDKFTDDIQATLQLLSAHYRIGVKTAEKDLLEAVGGISSKEWFYELRLTLDNVYSIYTNYDDDIEYEWY